MVYSIRKGGHVYVYFLPILADNRILNSKGRQVRNKPQQLACNWDRTLDEYIFGKYFGFLVEKSTHSLGICLWHYYVNLQLNMGAMSGVKVSFHLYKATLEYEKSFWIMILVL